MFSPRDKKSNQNQTEGQHGAEPVGSQSKNSLSESHPLRSKKINFYEKWDDAKESWSKLLQLRGKQETESLVKWNC